MDCNICCEVVNGNNKNVKCGFCDFTACTRCTERYLMDIHDDAHCMSCKKAWDIGILSTCMTATFLNTKYRIHKKETLFDREKSLLPQTQPDVDFELTRREQCKLKSSLMTRKQELIKELSEVKAAIEELTYGGNLHRETGGDGPQFIRKCPMDDCRGFLSRGWTCGICETPICKECNECKGDDHVCNPGNVETMKLLNKDSKPCPSCGTIITKIDGCDQMWCTQAKCHTAFSWRTGKKVFGNIHNPHFIQFSMNNGVAERNPQDIPCGGLPDVHYFFEFVRYYSSFNASNRKEILDRCSFAVRGLRHMIGVEENHYNVTDVRDQNVDLRVKYLLNEIDEKSFKQTIINRETARSKKKEFHNIIVMTVHTGSDILNVLYSLLQKKYIRYAEYKNSDIKNQMETIDKLREYANAQFARIGELYKCKYPQIKDDWAFIRSNNF